MFRISLLLFLLTAVSMGEDIEGLPVNGVQFVGSHNSYRLRTHPPLFRYLMNLRGVLPKAEDPAGWDYEHEAFDVQLGQYGVRSLEIDVYYDPHGGAFAKRQGNRLTADDVDAKDEALLKPGFKVLHFPDFDYRSNYPTFASALAAVKSWSDGHPGHEPLFLHLETKDESGAGRIPMKDLTVPPKWDASACDALDREIRAVFGRELFAPDELRGTRASLAAAATEGAWPALREMRGRVVFVMEGCAVKRYRAEKPALEGRASFIFGEPGRADSAFLLMNDPRNPAIRERVKEGYFVRTRADSDTREARSGDVSRRDAAFASGAQIVSTDYYRPDPRGGKVEGWSDYHVQIPGGGVLRRNPVSAAR